VASFVFCDGDLRIYRLKVPSSEGTFLLFEFTEDGLSLLGKKTTKEREVEKCTKKRGICPGIVQIIR